jgi:tetratricopeptide (TPR) repeat protein
LDKKPQAFEEYQAAIRDVEKARKEVGQVLDNMQKDDHYGWLRNLTVEAVTTAVRTYVPGSKVILENEKVKEAANAVAKMTEEQVSQVRAKLHDKLGNKIGDYLDPALRLGLALGRDLQGIARNFPLLIFFDTYEEIDEGDRLLRVVMGAAGIRVGWVVAGRDNLWAGLEQRERSVGKVYSFKEIVSPGLGLAIDFNTGGVGAFTASDIVEYFSLLRKKAPKKLALPMVTEEDAGRILEVTQGVPLAVRIAAGLYLEQANLVIVTEKPESKREIVDVMVERYLLHTRDEQDERARLYGLAMLRRADHPPAIAAALGLSPEEARTRYEAELNRLHRRYSFIFSEKEHSLLHQEVRHFLRLWLLEHRTQPEVVAVNEQLIKAHEDTLKKLEERRHYSSLRERLEDDEWFGTYLDLTEQHFWLDPVEGVDYAFPIIVAAAIYRRKATIDIVTLGRFFEKDIPQTHYKRWQRASQSLQYSDSFIAFIYEPTGLEELERLPNTRFPSFLTSIPSDGFEKELEAALWWRLGESYEWKDENKALKLYEQALSRLEQEIELREAIARIVRKAANKLSRENELESLSLYDKAIELNHNDSSTYFFRGLLYDSRKDYPKAITDYSRTIELNPTNADAYERRSSIYEQLKDYQRAIADFDRAIDLDPTYAICYYQRGDVCMNLKDYQQAVDDYSRAIELEPNAIIIPLLYNLRGKAYTALKNYQQAINDFSYLIELEPTHARNYSIRGEIYLVLENYPQAIADFDHAIDLDPTYANDYLSRGGVYNAFENYPQAIADFDRAIKLDSSNAITYFMRGIAYVMLKNYPQAFSDFDRAIELDSTNPILYFIRGSAYIELKDYQQAIANFDRAIELDPANTSIYQERSYAYLMLKDMKRAKSDFAQLWEQDSKNVSAGWMLAWSGMSREKPNLDIAQQLEEIAFGNSGHYAAYVCRGVALGLRGKLKEGLEEIEKAIAMQPEEWDAYFWKGMLSSYYYLGSYQKIREALEKSLEEGLPTMLLTPLYWLENDRPDFFEKYVKPLLERYDV